MDETWYRFEDVRYAAPVDEFDRSCGVGQLIEDRPLLAAKID